MYNMRSQIKPSTVSHLKAWTAGPDIPYVRHLSECIQRIIAPLKIHTCFRPHHTLRQALTRLKDPTPLEQRTGVVYRIPCGMCQNVYIGQRSRTLKHRLAEHRRALRSGEAALSAVAEHAIKEDHTIKWDDAEVVNHAPRYWQRCALEAWHIRSEKEKMNRDEVHSQQHTTHSSTAHSHPLDYYGHYPFA